MRNLKRALSLALASVMLVGMMVVGTSAASYPDVDAGKHDIEAIDVLEAVGVMKGDAGTGNFRPDDKVSRNEMAVIMARLILGTYAADSYVGDHPFTDVPSWADRYVAACYSSGIIKGTSATTYGGTSNVTAVQAAAMMLRALGYEDLSLGADRWDIPVAGKANEVNLFEGLTGSSTAQLSRNDIATLSLNALKTTMVTTTRSGNGQDITLPDGTTFYATRVYTERTNGSTWANKINVDTAPGSSGSYVQLGEHLYRGDLELRTTQTDDFGAPATQWLYKGKEVGKYANEADQTYLKEVKMSDIYKDLGLSAEMPAAHVKFVIDGVDDTTASQIYANDTTTDLNGVAITKNGANKDVKVGGKGAVTKVFYDSDADTSAGEFKVIVSITNYYLAKATENYDTKDEEINLTIYNSALTSATVKNEDVAVSDVQKDDYLVVTVSKDSGSWAVKTVAPAEVVENETVSAARNGDYVTAGGQKYEYSDIAEKASSGALGQSLMATASSYGLNGDGYNLYLDPNGYVLGVEGYDGGVNMKDYLFVKNVSTNGFDVIAKVLFSDGTEKTVTVTKVNLSGTEVDATSSNFTASQKEKFYKFSTSGDNYKLTAISQVADVREGAKATDKNLDSKINPIESNSTQYADDTTLFVAKDKAYTGVKNAPKITSDVSKVNDIYFLYSTAADSNNRLLWVYATQAGSVTTSVEDLIYIIDDKPTVGKDGDDDVWTYRVWQNGEETTIDTNNSSAAEGLYKVDTYSDGRADLPGAPITTTHEEFITGVATSYKYNNSVLAIGGMDSYYLKSDVKVYTVDGDTVKDVAPSSLGARTISDQFTNVILVKEKDEDDANIAVVYLIKGGSPMTGSLTEIAYDTATITTAITNAFSTSDTVKITGGAPTIGAKLEVPTGKTLEIEGGITGDFEVEVTGTLKAAGDVASSTTGVTVKAGGSAEITGAVTKVNDVEATGSLTVKGNKTIGTVTNNHGTITVEGTGTITTVTDNNGTITAATITTLSDLSAGTVNANVGTVADVTNAATTTATINGNVTTDVTNINSDGNVVFKGTVEQVTDITKGTVTFEKAVTQVLDISGGTVTFQDDASIVNIGMASAGIINVSPTVAGKAVTIAPATSADIDMEHVTLNLTTANAKVVLDGTEAGIDLSDDAITGVAGAAIEVTDATNNITIKATSSMFTSADPAQPTGDKLVVDTYTYSGSTNKFVGTENN